MKRVVSIIQEGDTTEVQWGSNEPVEGRIDGYVLIDNQGHLIVPFRTEADDAFVFVLGGSTTGVYATEDAAADHNMPPVWAPS